MTEYLSQKIRALWLLCMCMVVIVHAYNLPERYLHPMTMVQEPFSLNAFVQLFLANGFTRFGIPLFFMISGYLNYPKPATPHRLVALKRLSTLFVPYLLWSALGLLLYALVQENDFFLRVTQKAALGSFSDIPVLHYTLPQLLHRWLLEPIPFQLWFLRCLFMYTLLAPWLLRGVKRAPWIMLSIFGLLWFGDISFYLVEGSGLLFFSLGLWLRHRELNVQQAPTWFRLRWFAGVWLLLLLLKTSLAFGQYDGPSTTAQLFLFRICELLGVPVIWFTFDRLMRGRLPGPKWMALSNYTFIIYGMHVPLLHLISEGLFMTYGESEATRWWVFLVVVSSVISICLLTGMLLKRLTPTVFGWLTGGRGT